MQQIVLIAAFDAILACSDVLPDGTVVSESGWFLHRWGTHLLTGIADLLLLATNCLRVAFSPAADSVLI